jgi:hypothetical protein
MQLSRVDVIKSTNTNGFPMVKKKINLSQHPGMVSRVSGGDQQRTCAIPKRRQDKLTVWLNSPIDERLRIEETGHWAHFTERGAIEKQGPNPIPVAATMTNEDVFR